MTRSRWLVILIPLFITGTTGCLGTAYTYKSKADEATQAGDHKAAARYLALAATKRIAEEQSGGRSIQEDAGVLNCLAGEEYAKANEWSKAKESINEGIAILQQKSTHYYTEQFKCKVLLANIAMKNGDPEPARSLANEYIVSAPTRTEVLPGDLLAEILDATDRPLAIEIRAQVLLSKSRMHRGDARTLKSWADSLDLIAAEYLRVGNAEASDKFLKRSNAIKSLEIRTQDREPYPTSVPRLARQYRALGFPERAEHFANANAYTRISAAKQLAKQDVRKSNLVETIARDLCLAGLYFAESGSHSEAAAAIGRSAELLNASEIRDKPHIEVSFICKTASAILQARHSQWEEVKTLGLEYLNYPTPLTLTNDYSVEIGIDAMEPLAIKLDQLLQRQDSNLSIQIRTHYLNSLTTGSKEVIIQEHRDAANEYLQLSPRDAEKFSRWAEVIHQVEAENFGDPKSPSAIQSKIARYRFLELTGRADALELALQKDNESKRFAELKSKADKITHGRTVFNKPIGRWRDTQMFCVAALYSLEESKQQDAADFINLGMQYLTQLATSPHDEIEQITIFICRTSLALVRAQQGDWTPAEELAEEYLTYLPPAVDFGIEGVGFLPNKLAEAIWEQNPTLSGRVRVHFYGFLTWDINALLNLYADTAKIFLDEGENLAASKLLRMADFIREVEGEGDFPTNPDVDLKSKLQKYRALGFSERAIALERMAAIEQEKVASVDRESLARLREDLHARRNALTQQIESQTAEAMSAATERREKGSKQAESRYEECRNPCFNTMLMCYSKCTSDVKRIGDCTIMCNLAYDKCETPCKRQRESQMTKVAADVAAIPARAQCDNTSLTRDIDALTSQIRTNTKRMSIQGAKCYAARSFVGIAELRLMMAKGCQADAAEPQTELKRMQEQESAVCKGLD